MKPQLIYKNTQEIDRLNTEAWQLNRKSAVKAIDLANQALTLSLEQKYAEGIARAKKTLGACHVWISRNEAAANYCFEAISLFHSLHDILNEAETNYVLGINFFYLSDYDTAIKYYKRCYDLNVVKGSEPGMADALNGMGSVYYTIEQNDKALEVLLESQILCTRNNAKEILMKVQDGLGETFYNLGEYDKALSYYNKCIALILELDGSPQVHAFALDGLGRTYAGLKQFEKALSCYEQSLKIRLEMDFKFGVTATLTNIGKLYILKSNTEKAIKHLTDAFKMATKIGNKEGIYQSSEKLSELYSADHKYEEAYKYYRSFHQAREDVRTHKSEQLSKSLELQNKMLQSQAEKAILEERAKELENFSESLELMREVGQKIISNLSVANIVTTVYQSVNELMEAPGFGIGLYNKEQNIILYPLYIEGNERFENLAYDLEDETRLTAICFNQSREIVINDFENDIKAIISKRSPPKAGAKVASLIYLPLKHKDQVLGV
ncbi:MAG TPA: tetratricopeptide repeat protein, partial [Bacteroidia bacterium]|nr:tetratricopeptide repeat protein [Bacteroidia bacterium]